MENCLDMIYEKYYANDSKISSKDIKNLSFFDKLFKKMSLTEFIEYFNIDMILNNNLINAFEFDIENIDYKDSDSDFNQSEMLDIIIYGITDEILNYYNDNYDDLDFDLDVKNILDNIIDNTNHISLLLSSKLLELSDNDLELLFDFCIENFQYEIDTYLDGIYWDYVNDVYQYFIINNRDYEYFDNYTDYPIYYNYDKDLMLVGITHYGTSWDYIPTDYYKCTDYQFSDLSKNEIKEILRLFDIDIDLDLSNDKILNRIKNTLYCTVSSQYVLNKD